MPTNGDSTNQHGALHSDGQHQAPGVDSSSDTAPMTSHEEHGGAHDVPEGHGGDHEANGEHGGGQDRHEGHKPEMFRDRLLVSLVLTGPILYFSDQIQEWFSYEAVSFPGDSLVSPVLATVLFVYAGGLFLRGGLRELRVRPCVHALRAGQPMMLHIPATLEVMRASVLSMGLMSAPELDQVLADLRRHLSQPETLMISYAMIQVTGRVPGP